MPISSFGDRFWGGLFPQEYVLTERRKHDWTEHKLQGPRQPPLPRALYVGARPLRVTVRKQHLPQVLEPVDERGHAEQHDPGQQGGHGGVHAQAVLGLAGRQARRVGRRVLVLTAPLVTPPRVFRIL